MDSRFIFIRETLEEHYCSHPDFRINPQGKEECPPLDQALSLLEELEVEHSIFEGLFRGRTTPKNNVSKGGEGCFTDVE